MHTYGIQKDGNDNPVCETAKGTQMYTTTTTTKSLQSCPTLCDPVDGSPPGSPVPGILQARKQLWVFIFGFSFTYF